MELRIWVSKFVLILTYPRRFMLYRLSLLSPQSREHGYLVLYSFALFFFAHLIWITKGIRAFHIPGTLFKLLILKRPISTCILPVYSLLSFPFITRLHPWTWWTTSVISRIDSASNRLVSPLLFPRFFFPCFDASPDASRLIISSEQGIAYLDKVTWDGKLLM